MIVQWFDTCSKVNINGSCSSSLPVISGVPQGSVLGPLLCIIYFDDITRSSNSVSSGNASDVYLYADDAKVFNTNPLALQNDLNSLDEWLCSCQLSLACTLNVNICVFLIFITVIFSTFLLDLLLLPLSIDFIL